MKLGKLFSKKTVVRAKSDGGLSVGTPSWLLTDPRKKEQASEAQRSMRNKNFIPEMWLREDEEKMVRFRHATEIGIIWAYSLKLKNGRFTRVTAPDKGDADLFRDELGLKPSFKAIYEVIDIDGYVDKKTGKRKRNQPRFFVASHKMYEQLKKIGSKIGGLHTRNIEIARIGSGNQTTYTFMPQDSSPMTSEMKAAEQLRPKVAKLFAPPTETEQRGMLNQVAVKRDDDE